MPIIISFTGFCELSVRLPRLVEVRDLSLKKLIRELSTTEILERSLSLYSRRPLELFAPFFFAGILNGITKRVAASLLPPIILPQEITERSFQWLMSHLYGFVGASFVLALSFWVITTIASGIVVKYASDSLEKGDANLSTAFRSTLYKLGSLLAAAFICGVLMVLGFILFLVPGIIVVLMFSLVVPVTIIEDRGIFESLERSRRLVSGSWWKTFTVLLSVLLVAVFFSIIGEAVSIFFGPLRDIASALIQASIQPIYPLVLTYLYYSMRVKEAKAAKPVETIGYKPPFTPIPTGETPQPPQRRRFCIYCGRELPYDAVYCPRCGKRIRRYP